VTRARILLCLLALAASLSCAAAASAAPRWAKESSATIQPGASTDTAGAQCTANFVFYDRTRVYIGQAAHCSSTDDSSSTDGCSTHSLPLNTKVTIEGARKPGRLTYNSWITMQHRHERNANACADNDLALVRLDPGDARRVNPTIPHWGGPTGIVGSTRNGETVYTYGNSSLRQGMTAFKAKSGTSQGQIDGGWSHTVVSTLDFIPEPGTNGVGDLSRELNYLKRYTKLRVTLARGTRRFSA
jgi:hypothetical protein